MNLPEAFKQASSAAIKTEEEFRALIFEGLNRLMELEKRVSDNESQSAAGHSDIMKEIAGIEKKLATNLCDEESQEVISKLINFVFLVEGDISGSGVLFRDGCILTVAHLGFRLGGTYKVHGSNNRTYYVTCNFISSEADFALLRISNLPVGSEIMQYKYSNGDLVRGCTYYSLGFPQKGQQNEPSFLKTVIEGYHQDNVHKIGVPGARRGFSGAPVFSRSSSLCGIVCSALHDTNGDVMWNSVEQNGALILPTSAVEQVLMLVNAGRVKSDDISKIPKN